jgi:hypothetical protein
VFPCPCCGRLSFSGPPGSYEICPSCFWEDDVVQLRWPDSPGGANRPSLREAQGNVARYGAVEERFASAVRPAGVAADPGWRPLASDDDVEPTGTAGPWPVDRTTLYYWRRAGADRGAGGSGGGD